MTLMTVPIIDISPFYSGTKEARSALAARVDQACRDIGFLVITGHGVSKSLIERIDRTADQFFALPLEAKQALKRPKDDQVRGYSAVGDEGLSYSLGKKAPGDLKESFTIGPIDPPQDEYHIGPAAGPHFAPNLWPGIADFRSSWSEYFGVMSKLSSDLMKMFALGLKLPESYFEDKIDKHISMFRVLRYPNQATAPEEGQLRAGAHSDYGSLTIVRAQQDRPGSLEVCNKAGEWVSVPNVPDSFAVNIGDLMMQWTNDQWISTLHRVVNPPRELALKAERQSIVFFHQPNYDAMVSCLESCLQPGEKPKYPPVSSGDHLRMKFLRQTTFGASDRPAA